MTVNNNPPTYPQPQPQPQAEWEYPASPLSSPQDESLLQLWNAEKPKDEYIIRVVDLVKYFPLRTGWYEYLKRIEKYVHAVDNVSFSIKKGEILGVVGESGCGKTTLGRLLVRLEQPTSGNVFFKPDPRIIEKIRPMEQYFVAKNKLKRITSGRTKAPQDDVQSLRKLIQELKYKSGITDDKTGLAQLNQLKNLHSVSALKGEKLKAFRRSVQMIFQDPYESLNPRFTVFDTVGEPVIVHNIAKTLDQQEAYVLKALEDAELKPPTEFIYRYPHELSGGQRQRVAIARAIVLRPEFIVADEPVSMLDVSIRAGVMNLLLDLRDKYGLPILFITHDLSVARYMSDRIMVMYLGKVVEIAETEELIWNAEHPYTLALLSAVPVPDPERGEKVVNIRGELPSPIDIPRGCRFANRCIYAKDLCRQVEPELREIRPRHFVACHFDKEGRTQTV